LLFVFEDALSSLCSVKSYLGAVSDEQGEIFHQDIQFKLWKQDTRAFGMINNGGLLLDVVS